MLGITLLVLVSVGCGGRPRGRSPEPAADAGVRADAGEDAGADAGRDLDAGGDADSDADTDTGDPPDGGQTGCLSPEVDCGGACVDLSVDPANCGGCGLACGEGTTCELGLCRCEDSWYGHGVLYCVPGEDCVDGDCICPLGRVDCGDVCSDVSMDEANCGQCDGFCAGDCVSGVCRCRDDLVECERPAWQGGGVACTDLATDPVHCGTCGNVCGAGEWCVGGECVCRPGRAPCDAGWGAERCVDVAVDPANCGDCGTACEGETPLCWEGACVAECPRAVDECGAWGAVSASCHDFDDAEDACGGCGSVCGPSELCVEEACREWVPAYGCSECPCPTCGNWGVCCAYPGAPEQAVCVSAEVCPE